MAASAANSEQLTIDQLAQRVGMTVRNIRAHQSRGLLPPPEVKGRTGYYGPEHEARVELIKELQADGYNLDLIRRLIEGNGGSSAEVLRFTRAVRAPFSDEEPQFVDARRPGAALGHERPRSARTRPWSWACFATLATAASRSSARGSAAPARSWWSWASRSSGRSRWWHGCAATPTAPRARSPSSSSTRCGGPFDEAGRPEERWPEVQDALERLRPLAAESLLAVLQLAMNDVVEKEFGRTLESTGKRRRKR